MGEASQYHKFLRKYQQLQLGIAFNKLDDLGFATVSYSETDTSSFWNNALIERDISDKEVLEIEHVLKAAHRNPALYFVNTLISEHFIKRLQAAEYVKDYEDSWQFWQGGTIDQTHFESIHKIKTDQELELFLATYNATHRNNDPQNPYGELGNYLESARLAWQRHQATNRIEYFIIYKNSDPVSVSALTNYDGIGYISNIGSLQQVRGEGFGKAASLYCVAQSIKNNNTIHCLATEEGYYPHEFYQRIGFQPRFNAVCYLKTQINY